MADIYIYIYVWGSLDDGAGVSSAWPIGHLEVILDGGRLSDDIYTRLELRIASSHFSMLLVKRVF